jgi:hypothetical protein
LNFGWLQDKRLRFVAQTLPAFLYAISVLLGLVSQVGLFYAALIAIVGALVLGFVATRIVEKASPQSQPTVNLPPKTSSASAMRTRVIVPPKLQPVCDIGPHKVEAGEILSILLNIKQGQKVKGHLEEVNGQPFDWYIADEKNMVLLKKGERGRLFKPIAEGYDDRAYAVSRKIPWNARWFLILDTYGKQYSRKVRVDFEPVPA